MRDFENHAMVTINSTCTIVIGGFDGISNYASTFFYDRNGADWITGPSLMKGRYGHAAGIVTDEGTDEHFVAVTGGNYLNSTEILQDEEWLQGKINSTICHLPEIFWSHSTIFGYTIQSIVQEIACHFSQLNTMLEFYHKYPNQKVVK